MSSTYETMFYDSEDADSDFVPRPPNATYIDYVIDRPKGAWGAEANVRICHYTADFPARSAMMDGGRGSMNGGGRHMNGNNNGIRGGNNNMPNRNQGGNMSSMTSLTP
ncbi:hypothetical protein RvY_06414 [Ramazzottius varieornatus]|uniref:Uncharacterized protein n=1 Tax=Ramazzottius varieornatus TaxID=947166 RepID=A0A1D1UYI3_RAMVA|nr:hypothetical protein RvY_06414 [Ramazzottius varieornatus]